MTPFFSRFNAAFTLIEIAIVLVIIGLLAGGVLVAQDMRHTAKLHETIKQVRDIHQANLSFRDQYGGYPGDLRNATSFWPVASVVNGNGDRLIQTSGVGNCRPGWHSNPSGNLDCPGFIGERAQFFMQLGMAGLGDSYTTDAILGTGYPAIASNEKAGMIIGNHFTGAGSNNTGINNLITHSVYLFLGVCNPSNIDDNAFNDCGTLVPLDAKNIDSKLDDGKPLSGLVFGTAYNTICVTGSQVNQSLTNIVNTYDISQSSLACNLVVDIGS